MSIWNTDFGPDERRAVVDTARWIAGTMIFLAAVVAAVVITLSQ